MNQSLPKNPKQVRVEVYTKDYCPFCTAAMNLLTARGISFDEIDVTGDKALVDEMLRRAHPRITVPQIFIEDVGVGGFSDVKKLDEESRLESLIFPQGR